MYQPKSNLLKIRHLLLSSFDATTVIEDSPYRAFMQKELDSTLRFVTNKEHLQRNIDRIENGEISSTETSGGKNKHIVDLKIMVKTSCG